MQSYRQIAAPARRVCPVCRTSVYSLAGIHPQCAAKTAEKPSVPTPEPAVDDDAKPHTVVKA